MCHSHRDGPRYYLGIGRVPTSSGIGNDQRGVTDRHLDAVVLTNPDPGGIERFGLMQPSTDNRGRSAITPI
jgi:hypothetical protein